VHPDIIRENEVKISEGAKGEKLKVEEFH